VTLCSAAAAASASAFAFARAAGVTPVTECHSCEGGGVIQTQSFPLPCSLSDPLRLVTSSHLYKAPIFGSEELESCSVEPQNLQYISEPYKDVGPSSLGAYPPKEPSSILTVALAATATDSTACAPLATVSACPMTSSVT